MLVRVGGRDGALVALGVRGVGRGRRDAGRRRDRGEEDPSRLRDHDKGDDEGEDERCRLMEDPGEEVGRAEGTGPMSLLGRPDH